MANSTGASRRAQRAMQLRRRRDRRLWVAATALAVAACGVIALLLTGGSNGTVTDDDGVATVHVEMFEFGFDGDLTASSGALRITATNAGQINHNIGIRGGPITNEIGPGASVELDLGELAAGTYELYCDISGHADAGMVAALVITDAP